MMAAALSLHKISIRGNNLYLMKHFVATLRHHIVPMARAFLSIKKEVVTLGIEALNNVETSVTSTPEENSKKKQERVI